MSDQDPPEPRGQDHTDDTLPYWLNRRKLLQTIGLGVAGLTAVSEPTTARPDVGSQQSSDVSVSITASDEKSIQPGDQIDLDIEATNLTANAHRLRTYYGVIPPCCYFYGICTWGPTGFANVPGAAVPPEQITENSDPEAWVEETITPYWQWPSVEGSESRTTSLSIKLPEDIDPGSYEIAVGGQLRLCPDPDSDDPNRSTVTDSIEITVSDSEPEFEITAQSTTGAVAPGETIQLFPAISNTGDSIGDPSAYFQAATESTPHNADYYADEFDVVAHNDDGGDWQYEGWMWDDVEPGETREPLIELTVDETVEPGEYTFRVEVRSRGSSDDTATVTITVGETGEPGGDVSLTLAITDATAEAGGTATVTYVLTNEGSAESTGLQGVIDLPPGDWDIGDAGSFTSLGPGESDSVSAEVLVPESASGEYTIDGSVTDDAGNEASASATITVAQDNTPPNAAFTITPEGPTVGDTLTFDASGSNDPDGTIETYEWKVGDGDTFTPEGPEFTTELSEAGELTISLRVTDDDGGTDMVSKSVLVGDNTPPNAAFSVTPVAPVVGDTLTFDASSSVDPDGTIESYDWETEGFDSEGGESGTTGQVTERTVTAPGTVEIQLQVTDDDGGTDTITRAVTVEPDESSDDGGTGDADDGGTDDDGSTGGGSGGTGDADDGGTDDDGSTGDGSGGTGDADDGGTGDDGTGDGTGNDIGTGDDTVGDGTGSDDGTGDGGGDGAIDEEAGTLGLLAAATVTLGGYIYYRLRRSRDRQRQLSGGHEQAESAQHTETPGRQAHSSGRTDRAEEGKQPPRRTQDRARERSTRNCPHCGEPPGGETGDCPHCGSALNRSEQRGEN